MLVRAIINLTIEFGPIVAFVILAEFTDFITSTAVFVVLTSIALVASFYERKSFAVFPIVVAISVVFFGLLTVITEDPFFFIIKDTLYNGMLAIAVAVSLYLKKPLLKTFFKDTFDITDLGWTILTRRWGCMFAFIAISNEITRVNMTAEMWVIYKIFVTIVTAIFGFYQFTLSKKYRSPNSSAWGMRI